MTVLLWTYAALWLLFSLRCLLDGRAIPDLPGAEDGGVAPRVSAVVTTRDDADHIARTLRGLLAQRDVDLELIVVDDRSRDDTPAILERIAEEDPRVRVVRVETLPPGWLGKTHACHVGSMRAGGEWLLFCDSDARLRDDVLRRSVDAALREGVEHVTLFPGEEVQTLPGKATLLDFAMSGLIAGAATNRDRRFAFMGIGAFNLMRTASYREAGGHERLRLQVADDVGLGRNLRRAGFRTRVFLAPHDLQVEWAASARTILCNLEKNAFAIVGFRTSLALAVLLAGFLLHAIPLVGLWHGGPAGVAAFLAPWTLVLPTCALARRYGYGLLPGLVSPPFGLVLLAAMANSVFRALLRGGIDWRGTFYSLAQLRGGSGDRRA